LELVNSVLKIKEKEVREEVEKLNFENDKLYERVLITKRSEIPILQEIESISSELEFILDSILQVKEMHNEDMDQLVTERT